MDEAALVALYERTVDDVYRYACRLTGNDRTRAEDLTQDAYLALVRELRAGRLDVPTAGWLITCVRNRFIDEVRRSFSSERSFRLAWSNGAEPVDDSLPSMTGLDDVARMAVVLHHVDGFTVAEVAVRLGKSVRATESMLARSRSTLRREMEGRRRHG
jgi:RNA polymerase sigma-70 factor (ECF subfamily)